MKKTIHDMLDIYALKHKSDDIFLMLQDYVLDPRLSREDLNDKIVLDLGERTPYWNHTELLKTNIENWFATHEDNIKKLVDSIELEYNPLYNTDYYEKVDNARKTDNTRQVDNKRTEDLESHSIPDDTVVSENRVSAYDSGAYQPQDMNTTHNTGNSATTGDNVITDDNKIVDDNKTVDDNLKHHYGKEGTESYADIIDKERRLAEFNIYDWIVNQLDSEICLGVF